jgi:hypothetical protein
VNIKWNPWKFILNVIPVVHLELEALLHPFYVRASHLGRSYIILILRLSIKYTGAFLTVDDRVLFASLAFFYFHFNLPIKWLLPVAHAVFATLNYLHSFVIFTCFHAYWQQKSDGKSSLGTVAKFLKVIINFVFSVFPHETTRFALGGFSQNFIFEHFLKICRENSRLIKIWQI